MILSFLLLVLSVALTLMSFFFIARLVSLGWRQDGIDIGTIAATAFVGGLLLAVGAVITIDILSGFFS